MAFRTVEPDTTTLETGDGDWIVVKRRLTAGEHRRIFSRMVKTMHGDQMDLDPLQVGRSQAVEYLLDWSVKKYPIAGKSAEDIGKALDMLDLETFNAIVKMITHHEKAMDAEREAEKNGRGGETTLSAISSSAA